MGDDNDNGNDENGAHVQEITFTANDGSGRETRGTVAVRSAAAKQHAINVSMMYKSNVIDNREL